MVVPVSRGHIVRSKLSCLPLFCAVNDDDDDADDDDDVQGPTEHLTHIRSPVTEEGFALTRLRVTSTRISSTANTAD